MGLMDYRFGFILASRQHRFIQQSHLHGWNRVLTPRYKLFVHPETTLYKVEDKKGRVVIVIGDIFVAHGSASLDEILFRMADGDRASLDDLAGRFAIIIMNGEEGSILHDPLGSQAVFYTLGVSPVVSSHSSLIALCDELPMSNRLREYMSSDEYRARVTRFLPGDLSLYDGVVHLIPNNELDLRTGATSRYWPRQEFRAATFDELLAVWEEYFRAYVAFLAPRYDPVIGITGGLDSRAVIAAMNKMNLKARYITWDKMPEEEAVRIPKLIAHLEARHDWVRMDERPASPEVGPIREAARAATGFTRGLPMLPAQIAATIGLGGRHLFVKGLGGEVMRGPYNSRFKSHLPRGEEDLAYALYAGEVRKTAGWRYEQLTRSAIRQFFLRANYESNTFGADVGDLIYWEQRMGTWTAIQHAEFSVVLNSHSAMNSRRLFTTSWGLPDSERFGSTLLRRLIEHYDAEFAAL